jgi:methanogenic corrinoid protein MtbC1
MEGHQTVRFDTSAYHIARRMIGADTSIVKDRALKSLASDVIARLAGQVPRAEVRYVHPGREEIAALCDALLSCDEGAARAMIEDLHGQGASVETLCFGYIAGAARRLGRMWDRDEVGFLEMTMAVGRMYGIICGLRRPAGGVTDAALDRTALFAAVPGEQHTLGVTMAAEFFRSRGWQVDTEIGADHEAIVSRTEAADYAVAGLSAASAEMYGPLCRLIAALRIACPATRVLLAGHIVAADPAVAARSGADGQAGDIETAFSEMERLCAGHRAA